MTTETIGCYNPITKSWVVNGEPVTKPRKCGKKRRVGIVGCDPRTGHNCGSSVQ